MSFAEPINHCHPRRLMQPTEPRFSLLLAWSYTVAASLVLVVPSFGVAQAPAAPVQASAATSATGASDSQVKALLTSALQALGGTTAIGNLATWTVQATSQPGPAGGGYDGQIVWKFSKGEFRAELQKNGNSNIMVTGHGKPANVVNGNVIPMSIQYAIHRTFTPMSIGALLTNAIRSPRCANAYLGPTKNADGSAVIQIKLNCGPVIGLSDEQIWSFDPKTNLPSRVDWTIPGQSSHPAAVLSEMAFSDYRPVQGVQCPFLLQLSHGGVVFQTISLQGVDTTTPISSDQFDPTKVGGAK